jgi:tRNA pseudouridine55 synthase
VGFEVFGTKGLLVRSLVDEVGEALGCGAALESLRRVRVGKFKVEDAVSFEKLLETELKDFPSCVMPLGAALL